ncbi:tetratricopeptide repeat protein [Synechocystis sp. PCC 6714]|uniref:tetratricopeptide repeat protein n=1 Tax=Synechocystis sp. (strain PCC 6714) TaxID=1147 RepID=UPI000491722F|nr:tetratricopeptide repeat protein [Synechocystis sp. PCC 6714]AIE76236.1 hypothetical protein D082_50740 [Synechocystis sp. PCC 6714]
MNFSELLSVVLAIPLTTGLPVLNCDHLSIFGIAPAIAQVFPDITSPTAQLYLQADSLISLGFIEEGMALYEQLLKGIRETGDRQEEAKFLHAIASSFQLRGDLERALTYYERALDLSEDIPLNPENQSFDINEIANVIGSIYLVLGQNEQALIAYERAVEIDQKFGLQWQGIGTLSNIGTAHRLAGNLEQALASYQQGLFLAEETDDNYFKAKIFNKIGMLYQAQGQFELALNAYQQGLVAVTDQPKEYQIVDLVLTLENLSNLYQSQGQIDQAKTYEQQAKTAIAQASVDQYGDASLKRGADFLEDIGEFYLVDGQPERAKDYFDRAVAIVHPMSDDYAELNLLNSILVTYRKQEQIEAALPYQERHMERVLKMGLFENSATSFFGLGEIYQTIGKHELALTAYQQALKSYQEGNQAYGGQTENIVRSLRKIGEIYEAQDKPEQALMAYQEALKFYPEEQTEGLLGKLPILEALVKFYTTQGQNDQAQKYFQQAQILRDLLFP